MKKKKKRTRITKKDLSVHRKLIRRDASRNQLSGIRFDQERYLQSISATKRKLAQIEEHVKFILNNAEQAKEPDRNQDLRHAREYCEAARNCLGYTEYFCTDAPAEKKGKLNRPKKKVKLNRPKKKGKLNRRLI